MIEAKHLTDFAEGLADGSQYLTIVVEAVAGYKRQLEASGFSPTAAEVASIEYHNHLLKLMFASISTGGKST